MSRTAAGEKDSGPIHSRRCTRNAREAAGGGLPTRRALPRRLPVATWSRLMANPCPDDVPQPMPFAVDDPGRLPRPTVGQLPREKRNPAVRGLERYRAVALHGDRVVVVVGLA